MRVIGKDFCEEAGLGVECLLDAWLGEGTGRVLSIESRSAVRIIVGPINSLTRRGLRSGPLALRGLALSFAFWMNGTALLEKGL